MATSSVRAVSPPGQDDVDQYADGFLGEYWPTRDNRCTLHREDAGAVLMRHRHPGISDPSPDRVAQVAITDGKVAGIQWDEFHQTHQPVWMPSVEDWIRATIEAAS